MHGGSPYTSLGHSLPPEIIANIVDQLTSCGTQAAATNLTKAELSLCSRTCRYWAHKCRPLLFREVTLTSRDEALALLQFVRRSQCSIGEWIKTLVLIQREPSLPWTHLIYLQFLNGRPNLPRITHVLDGSRPTTTNEASCVQALHGLVPRSLPTFFYQCLNIRLINVLLRSASSLLRLVGRMKLCTSLYCENVSLAQCVSTTSRIHLMSARRSLIQDIQLHNCSDVWMYARLCVTTDPTTLDECQMKLPAPYIRGRELESLETMLRAICPERECRTLRLSRDEPSSSGFSISFACEQEESRPTNISVEINGDGVIIRLAITFGCRSETSSSGRWPPALLCRYDWRTVSLALSACTALNDIQIDVYANGFQVGEVERHIKDKLELQNSDRPLRITFWKCSGETSGSMWEKYVKELESTERPPASPVTSSRQGIVPAPKGVGVPLYQPESIFHRRSELALTQPTCRRGRRTQNRTCHRCRCSSSFTGWLEGGGANSLRSTRYTTTAETDMRATKTLLCLVFDSETAAHMKPLLSFTSISSRYTFRGGDEAVFRSYSALVTLFSLSILILS
ncbi:hypothetical protein BC629DRAFT_61551 [Irpex lacteus]|nr:hypothetical protein BC629DRAFT_61551 [Irpex lacteus]